MGYKPLFLRHDAERAVVRAASCKVSAGRVCGMLRVKAVVRAGMFDFRRECFVVSDARCNFPGERRYPRYPITVDEILEFAVLSPHVSRPALDDPLCVDRLRHVCGIGFVEHFGHIHDVIGLEPVPPPYIVAEVLMVAGQLHQREVRKVVSVYVDQPDRHCFACLELSGHTTVFPCTGFRPLTNSHPAAFSFRRIYFC